MKSVMALTLLFAGLLGSAHAAAQGASVVGSWKLVSVTATAPDGRKNDAPYGAHPTGALNYSADGRVMLIVSYDGRPNLLPDRTTAPVAARAEAYSTFFAYSGRYSVADGKMTHHIEVASYPNWVGTDLVRVLKVDGNRLTLVTPPLSLNGATQTNELVWERVGPAGR